MLKLPKRAFKKNAIDPERLSFYIVIAFFVIFAIIMIFELFFKEKEEEYLEYQE